MPSRERTIRTNAVVLRYHEMGEADRLLTLFTEQKGKVRAIAKGVRKVRSRKAGHLEPFTYSNLQLAKGRDLFIITQAETINAFLPLRQSLIGLGQAAYVIELVDRFTYEEGENAAILRLIVRTLDRLENETDPNLVLRYFDMRLLDLLGFRPELHNCVSCKREIVAEDQYFSAERGGIVCNRCSPNQPGIRPVSVDTLRYFRHFQRSSFNDAKKAEPNSKIHTEMEILMHHYLTYLLERNLNTPAFIRKIKNEIDLSE